MARLLSLISTSGQEPLLSWLHNLDSNPLPVSKALLEASASYVITAQPIVTQLKPKKPSVGDQNLSQETPIDVAVGMTRSVTPSNRSQAHSVPRREALPDMRIQDSGTWHENETNERDDLQNNFQDLGPNRSDASAENSSHLLNYNERAGADAEAAAVVHANDAFSLSMNPDVTASEAIAEMAAPTLSSSAILPRISHDMQQDAVPDIVRGMSPEMMLDMMSGSIHGLTPELMSGFLQGMRPDGILGAPPDMMPGMIPGMMPGELPMEDQSWANRKSTGQELTRSDSSIPSPDTTAENGMHHSKTVTDATTYRQYSGEQQSSSTKVHGGGSCHDSTKINSVAASRFAPDIPSQDSGNLEQPSMPSSSTESLFIPMYRREQFVLGELYGKVSPNSLALSILRQGCPPLEQISRRFVVDLSAADNLEFVEYEWFSDGLLVVSMHDINLNGDYQGQSIVLSTGGSSSSSDSRVPSRTPSRVLMRLTFDETVDCPACSLPRADCHCRGPTPAQQKLLADYKISSSSWSAWIAALERTRKGNSTTVVSFTISTPMGDVKGLQTFRLEQCCSRGEASGAALLRRKYAFSLSGRIENPYPEVAVSDEDVVHTITRMHEQRVESNLQHRRQSASVRFSEYGVRDGGVAKKNFACECGRIFTHRGHLNVHVLSVHLKLKPFSCSLCSSSFAKRSDLRRHVIALHREHNIASHNATDGAAADDDNEMGSSKPLVCSAIDCGRRYATRQGLRKHEISKHGRH